MLQLSSKNGNNEIQNVKKLKLIYIQKSFNTFASDQENPREIDPGLLLESVLK